MNCKNNPQRCRFVFLGVFILGLVGVSVTARYYLRKEPVADRQARSQRIAAEVNRLTH